MNALGHVQLCKHGGEVLGLTLRSRCLLKWFRVRIRTILEL